MDIQYDCGPPEGADNLPAPWAPVLILGVTMGQKTVGYRLRMEPVKKRVWEAAAAREGRSLAEWLTRAGDLAQAARPYLTPADIEAFDGLREQLRRAGVNLNTLVRSTLAFEQGRGRDMPDRQQFEEVRAELKEAMSKILAMLEMKA